MVGSICGKAGKEIHFEELRHVRSLTRQESYQWGKWKMRCQRGVREESKRAADHTSHTHRRSGLGPMLSTTGTVLVPVLYQHSLAHTGEKQMN